MVFQVTTTIITIQLLTNKRYYHYLSAITSRRSLLCHDTWRLYDHDQEIDSLYDTQDIFPSV